jgi:thymidylate synthase
MHVDEAWVNLLEQCLAKTSKYEAKQDSIREVIGAHVILDGSAEQFLMNPRRKLSPIYASAELLWYLRREKSAAMIQAYAPAYTEFCDDGIHAHGAYGDRLANNLAPVNEDLLNTAITLLKKRASTKKAVVLLWRPDDLLRAWDNDHAKESRDVPCTVSWQFIARGERLHMICTMRSNDLWKGFLYDCYVNTVIQRYVAASLGLTAGEYHHIAGSEHLYERDAKKAQEALDAAYSFGLNQEYDDTYHPQNSYWDDFELQHALAIEKSIREKTLSHFNAENHPQALRDALLCCAAKWCDVNGEVTQLVRAPGLRRGLEAWCATR